MKHIPTLSADKIQINLKNKTKYAEIFFQHHVSGQVWETGTLLICSSHITFLLSFVGRHSSSICFRRLKWWDGQRWEVRLFLLIPSTRVSKTEGPGRTRTKVQPKVLYNAQQYYIHSYIHWHSWNAVKKEFDTFFFFFFSLFYYFTSNNCCKLFNWKLSVSRLFENYASRWLWVIPPTTILSKPANKRL